MNPSEFKTLSSAAEAGNPIHHGHIAAVSPMAKEEPRPKTNQWWNTTKGGGFLNQTWQSLKIRCNQLHYRIAKLKNPEDLTFSKLY